MIKGSTWPKSYFNRTENDYHENFYKVVNLQGLKSLSFRCKVCSKNEGLVMCPTCNQFICYECAIKH